MSELSNENWVIVDRLTPDVVRSVWTSMQKLNNTTVGAKSDSNFMSAVGSTLDLLGVQDKERFLKHYTTTINRQMYLHFTIGSAEMDLVGQLALCAHEHQHVVITDRVGLVTYSATYLADHAARVIYEVECYTATMEVVYWCTGTIDAGYPRRCAEALRDGYAGTDGDVVVAERALNIARETALSGLIVTKSAQQVVQLIEVQLAA